jgi:hypothetical protein
MKINNKNLFLFVSFFFSLFLILPENLLWATDRISYLFYAINSSKIVENYLNSGSIITLISNEPLFLFLNIFFSYFFSPTSTVKSIIFITSFLNLLAIGRLSKYNLIVLIVLLFTPIFLLKLITHIRQGFAMGIYLYFYSLSKGNPFRLFRFLSPFIHSVQFFIILIEFLATVFKHSFTFTYQKIFFFSLLTLFIFISLPFLLELIGDRRLDSYDFSFKVSGSLIGFFFWFGFLLLIILKNDNSFFFNYSIIAILFYLLGYFYLDFSARIIESSVPTIIVYSLQVKNFDSKLRNFSYFSLFNMLLFVTGRVKF